MEKKRKHIFVYWLMMVGLFVVVLLSQQVVASIMQGSLSSAKYGSEATFEILWAGLVLIIVLLFKNKYIFTQKREGFFQSFKYILPELLLSGFFILLSTIIMISNNNSFSIYSVFNLALYCLFVGIVEEFLCRGWLLNEFLERYSRNRKEILLSILFSSLIFGVIHFLNIGETQGFFETLVQVMNATAGGVFLSLVYYKTKNIWIVVFTHALWDFSLFLSEVNSMGDCLASTPTSLTIIVNIFRGLFLIIAYVLFCYWLYRQTDLYNKEVKNTRDYIMAIGVAIYVVTLLFVHDNSGESLCPDYSRKAINQPYSVSYYNYSSYKYSNYILEVDSDTNRLLLNDNLTNKNVYLTNNDKYYDYLLVENDRYFTILIKISDNVLLYGKYYKNDMYKDDYFEKIPMELDKIVVPSISSFGVINIEGDSYHYPTVKSEIGELFYFDQDNKLYLNK